MNPSKQMRPTNFIAATKRLQQTAAVILVLLIAGLPTSTPVLAEEIDPLLIEPVQSTACQHHLAQPHTAETIAHEIAAFKHLAEEALALRAVTIKVGLELQQKAAADLPLTGEDLDLLSMGLATHLDLRQRLFKVAEAHECWLSLSSRERVVAHLSDEAQLEGIMLSLAAALVLYDNYLHTATLFQGDPKLRQLLNNGDLGYKVDKAELLKVTLSYNSIINRARVRRAIRYYEESVAQAKHEHNPYLTTLIDQSPSYDMVRRWSPLHTLSNKLDLYGDITLDSVALLQNEGISLFSMLFGNTVGLVETRKGKLYQSRAIQSELQSTLKSGDILLEKTPFRLTDKLIPGYWGHAAVWIGTEQELKDLDLWDHPLVKQYQPEIRAGRTVVEALRSGVEMNSLQSFLNIDSIGVLRRNNLTPRERRQIVLQTLRQVGKGYDFNFDVESLDRVYCSKLIYLAYHGIDWPVQESFGRTTFTPDDVASSLFDENRLQLVTFYHDGQKVQDQATEILATLMAATK